MFQTDDVDYRTINLGYDGRNDVSSEHYEPDEDVVCFFLCLVYAGVKIYTDQTRSFLQIHDDDVMIVSWSARAIWKDRR